jgi:hypothetical protein
VLAMVLVFVASDPRLAEEQRAYPRRGRVRSSDQEAG